MPTDVREPVASTSDRPATSSRTHGRRGTFLLLVAVWTVWLFGTRAWNLLTGDEGRSAAFIAVHLVLYAVSFGIAGALTVLGVRMRREAREGTSGT